MNRTTGQAGRTAVLLAVTAASLAGCATGMRAGAADVPRLEAAAAATPADADLATELGVAYYHAGRFHDARAALARGATTGARAGTTALYAGMASEQLGDWPAARAAYEQYISAGRSGRLRTRITERLALVARNELRHAARLALEREAQLSDQPPTERSIAVLPFELTGGTEELQPLRAALADMVITDLALTGRLVTIERARVGALLDEMVLAQAGFTTAETGARAGRLLRAQHIVQGGMDLSTPEQLRLDGAVLSTVQRASIGEVRRTGALASLFDLQKQFVFDIHDRLGIQLTPAERERISENRTSNLIAFLTYGRGLDALDRGDFAGAAALFRESLRLDPGFATPQAHLANAQQLAAADAVTLDALGMQGLNELNGSNFGNDDSLLTMTVDEVNDSPVTGLVGGGGMGSDAMTQAGTRTGPLREASGGQGIGSAVRAGIRILVPRRSQP
jgi:TolB-like protein